MNLPSNKVNIIKNSQQICIIESRIRDLERKVSGIGNIKIDFDREEIDKILEGLAELIASVGIPGEEGFDGKDVHDKLVYMEEQLGIIYNAFITEDDGKSLLISIDDLIANIDDLIVNIEAIQDNIANLGALGEEVKDIHTTLRANRRTFIDIFTEMSSQLPFNPMYIPSLFGATSEPSYALNGEGVCTIANIEISTDNVNYNERLCVLKNICKLYSSYKFQNCTFNNADLSELFNGNTFLTTLPMFENITVSGTLNLNRMFANCTNLDSLEGVYFMIHGICYGNAINRIILDNMFVGCNQFANITYPIALDGVFFNASISYISMENVFEPVVSIDCTRETDIIAPISMQKILGTLAISRDAQRDEPTVPDTTLTDYSSNLISINVKNMFKNLVSITSNTYCISFANMLTGCSSVTNIELSDMFPSLRILRTSGETSHIDMSNMFNGCVNLKTVDMINFMSGSITPDLRITYVSMLNSVLSISNPSLVFSYNGFMFSNALGSCYEPYDDNLTDGHNNNYMFGDSQLDTDTKPIGFPYYHGVGSDKENNFEYYDGQMRKIITWTYNENDGSQLIKQDTIIC